MINLEQHTARDKKAMEKLLATHTFDYMMLRVNPGLTSCENLATAVDNSLDNN